MSVAAGDPRVTTGRWRPAHWERSIDANGSTTVLELSALETVGRLWFLEHVVDRSSRRATAEVIARLDSTLYVSGDLGETWRPVPGPDGVVFSFCFTTASGTHLLQEIDAPQVHRFDPAWRYLGASEAGNCSWHGSWSIDQAPSGVIMFGEYASAAVELHVHRSLDDGATWAPVLMQPGHPSEPTAGRIRHFHTCTADPFVAGRWYVSSGDRGDQNRLWCSDDDGASWRPLSPRIGRADGVPIPDNRLPNVVRHTAEVVLEDAVVWPTDDNLGTQARLVRLRKPDLDVVDVVTSFGRNELRNLVVLDSESFMVVSESKLDPSHAEAYLVDPDGGLEASFRIENPAGASASFARSRSSRAAVDGTFFSFTDLELPGKPRLLRWRVARANTDGPDAERDELQARIAAETERFGSEDSGVQALECAYRSTFCCNVCSAEIAAALTDGDEPLLAGLHDPRRFTDERQVEYACPHCRSRIRQRTGRILVEQELVNQGGRLLLVSASRPDQAWLRERYSPVTHVTLAGDFGDPSIIGGVDISDMPQIPSASFDLMTASCVLDYIPELDAVAREAYRVLAPGGEFAFFIMPYRLVEGGTGCVVKHRNALAHEAYAQTADGGDTGVPDCEFGTEFVRRAFTEAGFELAAVPVHDALSRTSHVWHVARKQTSQIASGGLDVPRGHVTVVDAPSTERQ